MMITDHRPLLRFQSLINIVKSICYVLLVDWSTTTTAIAKTRRPPGHSSGSRALATRGRRGRPRRRRPTICASSLMIQVWPNPSMRLCFGQRTAKRHSSSGTDDELSELGWETSSSERQFRVCARWPFGLLDCAGVCDLLPPRPDARFGWHDGASLPPRADRRCDRLPILGRTSHLNGMARAGLCGCRCHRHDAACSETRLSGHVIVRSRSTATGASATCSNPSIP